MSRVYAVLAVALWILFGGGPLSGARAQEVQDVRIESSGGESTITIRSRTIGYAIDDYAVRVDAGARAAISFQSDHPDSHFDILDPDEADAVIFDGVAEGDYFEGTLPRSGKIGIRVYLTRNAARRGETADYTLKMSVATVSVSVRSGRW
jgi:hypothetical protein